MADSNKKNLAPRLRPRAERLRSQSCIPFSPAGAARAAATIRRVNRCIARIRKYEKKLSEFLFAFRFPMIRSQAASTRFTGQHWLPWIACPGLDPRAAITSCLLPCAARRVSSKRAVMVTVSLSSPASIGVGAAAPAVYAREKATGGWRPASSVSTMSRPILAPPATLQGALRWRLQLGASGVTRAIRSSDPSASPQSADRPQNSSGRIRSDRAEILGLRRRRCRSPNSPRLKAALRLSFGEGRASQNGDAGAAWRARRPIAQEFRAVHARPVGELLAGRVFDRMSPDGRVGIERGFGKVERTVRLNFHPKSRAFERLTGQGVSGASA
jgi:hypothetical protein